MSKLIAKLNHQWEVYIQYRNVSVSHMLCYVIVVGWYLEQGYSHYITD